MSAEQIHAKLEERIATMSQECDRRIVGDRTIGGIPFAAYALVAPQCVLYCQPLIPERDIFIDFCLN